MIKEKNLNDIKDEFDIKLFDIDNVSDLIFEFIESNIDTLFSNEFIASVPILGIFKLLVKGGLAIKERNLMRNTLCFMKALNIGKIDEKFEKHRKKIINNDKQAKKELERTIILLDRFIDSEKATILGNLYLSYINEEISCDYFNLLRNILDSMFLDDVEVLLKVFQGHNELITVYYRGAIDRLLSVGLVYEKTIDTKGSRYNHYIINVEGKFFIYYGLKRGNKPPLRDVKHSLS